MCPIIVLPSQSLILPYLQKCENKHSKLSIEVIEKISGDLHQLRISSDLFHACLIGKIRNNIQISIEDKDNFKKILSLLNSSLEKCMEECQVQ